MCAGRATRRAPGAFASDRRRTRALAARKARALEPKEQARPGDPLRTVALGWSRPFPRRRAGRDRLQYSRAIDQASRPHAQKRPLRGLADSDEAGQAFQEEAGHRFRFEAGRDSDLMSATWRLLPRIDAMMFCPEPLVKRAWIW